VAGTAKASGVPAVRLKGIFIDTAQCIQRFIGESRPVPEWGGGRGFPITGYLCTGRHRPCGRLAGHGGPIAWRSDRKQEGATISGLPAIHRQWLR
jgi:hypothetical protein